MTQEKLSSKRITFELFLQILKEAQVRNKRGIAGNYLADKNIFFEKVSDTSMLPALKDGSGGYRRGNPSSCIVNADLQDQMQAAEQYQGNGPLNFFQGLRQAHANPHRLGAKKPRQSKSFELQQASKAELLEMRSRQKRMKSKRLEEDGFVDHLNTHFDSRMTD